MKKVFPVVLILVSASVSASFAANLMDVYQDALRSDPTYLAAKTTYLSAIEDEPIALGALLPQVTFGTSDGYLNETEVSGSRGNSNGEYGTRGYDLSLSITQQVFNYSAWQALKKSKETVQSAAATFYDAEQNLMVLVSTDYVTILQDQEIVNYNAANVEANKKSLDQAKQQYEVGLNTKTDVYTSQAAYSSAVSSLVAAKNTLANDEESLRAVTGRTYKTYESLSDKFPMASPDPEDIEEWVQVAVNNNWSLKASHYSALAAMREVKIQFGGRLPQLYLQANYSNRYSYLNEENSSLSGGSQRLQTGEVSAKVTVPLFTGGTITSEVKQAEYDYQTALHVEEEDYRSVVTVTRQAYLDIISGISVVAADSTSVQSNKSALKGLEAGYKVGTQTMIDVLNQQSLLFEAQQGYVNDRYSYVLDLINLKHDAGTLDAQDLYAINQWLGKAPAANKKNNQDKLGLQTLQSHFQDDSMPEPPQMEPNVGE